MGVRGGIIPLASRDLTRWAKKNYSLDLFPGLDLNKKWRPEKTRAIIVTATINSVLIFFSMFLLYAIKPNHEPEKHQHQTFKSGNFIRINNDPE